MALAFEEPGTSRPPAAPRRRPRHPSARAQQARVAALRRIVAEVSADLGTSEVFEDVLDSSHELFGAPVAGLWLIQPGEHLFRLVAQRNLAQALVDEVAGVTARDDVIGVRAIHERRPIVIDDPSAAPRFASIYLRLGFRTINFVPLLFRDEPVGLLVLYHTEPYDWTPDELALVTSFANQMATAVANARLYATARDGAARLRAIADLSARLNRIQDVEGIGEAIVAEADRLIAHDTIRVYRVDHRNDMCEPIAFQGEFTGIGRPSRDMLRLPIGEGLTGWVAQHNASIRLGDAAADPRGRQIGNRRGPESMLLVPMSFESRVMGVIVVSKLGTDAFSEEDQQTLEIFAGYAAQALANAEAFAEVRRQRQELSHRLESQRRLLEVNERLLATLDPSGVLEMIADSLKTVVSYDALTIYRVDRAAGVRRAVVARDQFAAVILSHEPDLDAGITGWAIRRGEAVLANDAHVDPRSIQIPGTPEEPESMIVCPLLVAGEVIGTLNVSRMGADESHFSQDEFELVQLFAAQASIALRNAEAHGAVVTQAEHDALTGLRNHGAFQRELGEWVDRGAPFAMVMLDLDAFKAYNDTHGHPAGDRLLGRISEAMRASIREGDRLYRYGGDEFAMLLPGVSRDEARDLAQRVCAAIAALTQTAGPLVTSSVGLALYPEDATTKNELVAIADGALYVAKPADRSRPSGDGNGHAALPAVDDTTLRLLGRLGPDELLRAIVGRATSLVGVRNGYLSLLEDGGAEGPELISRVGTGIYGAFDGYRLPAGEGVGWAVVRTGQPVVLDDYDQYLNRAHEMPAGRFGAVCVVPLISNGDVLGVLGLASGTPPRPFTEREVAALVRFGQLASIALDHARLFGRADTEMSRRAHAALHDTLTGLPNRTALLSRLAERLQSPSAAGDRQRPTRLALLLLDLDRFKVVNESLGHAAGDALLVQVGRRLVSAVRRADTVARLGSDEFGVLLGRVRSERDAQRVAGRIEAALARPFELDGREVAVSASLGLAVGRAGEAYGSDLLKEAEIALHRAKADLSRTLIVFDPEMRAQTVDRATMEHDLRRALDRDELRLHYQPIVDLGRDAVVGVEALLRWQHPTRGLVPPLAFIPLAEETGLILPIGRWVLEQACRDACDWRRRFPDLPGMVSVNLSARQFAQADLVGDVAAILDRTGLPAESLELEITESVVMDQSEASVDRLRSLRRLGVRLVLDDFGTGYSSLSYLRRLPLDTIKIDRSFVAGLGSDDADLPIVQAVISLAHGLGIEVVAEGIETPGQLRILRQLLCDRGQGFLYAAPLPPAEVEQLLAEAGPDGDVVLRRGTVPEDSRAPALLG